MTQPTNSIGTTIVAIASLLLSTQCLGAAITFDLTGDTTSLRVFNGNVAECTSAAVAGCAPPGTTIIETDYIIPSITGFPAGFAISVGDTLSGVLTLNSALTVPGGNVTANRDYGAQVYLNLGLGPTGIAALNIGLTQSLTFLLAGVPVAESGLFDVAGGSLIDLILGGLAPTPTPSFAFDQLAFNAQVTRLIDGATRQEFATVDIRPPSGTFDFTYRVYNSPILAVPEPTALALVGLGLACIGAVRRRAGN